MFYRPPSLTYFFAMWVTRNEYFFKVALFVRNFIIETTVNRYNKVILLIIGFLANCLISKLKLYAARCWANWPKS